MNKGTQNINFKRRLAISLFITILATIFWSSASLQKLFLDSTSFTSQYLQQHNFIGVLVFWVISVLSAILSPFTSIPFVPIAIATWGKTLTMFLLLLGWLSGAIVSYYLGSFTVSALIKNIFAPKKVENYINELSSIANFFSVIVFRLAMPSEIAGYVLGAIKYNFVKYLLATLITETPFVLIVVYSGEALINADKERFVFLIFFALILTTLTYYIFNKLKK